MMPPPTTFQKACDMGTEIGCEGLEIALEKK